ncbi:MAG: TIGR02172 family protein [Bacteroidales bacterium]|jgi:uncharacterized protein (TIGR02172 family)|nr:TIGR02172 family protein [Bacteroidales bacterium]
MDYRSIDITAWTKVGEGGNGFVYENSADPDVILKVNKPGLSTLEFFTREYETSKAVEGLGLSVPKMHEIVRVGDAYASISQRIKNKRSLARICKDEPERTEEMARVLSDHFKKLSSTPCNSDFFPSRKEQLMKAIEKVQFIGKKNRQSIISFARTIDNVKTCSHGDLNMGNLIFADGKYYWIDLDRFGYGDRMFDIGHLFQICHAYASMKQVQDIFHMSEEQLHRFWDAFAKAFTGKNDYSEFDKLAGQFACMDIVLAYQFHSKVSFAEKLFFAIQIRSLIKKYFE